MTNQDHIDDLLINTLIESQHDKDRLLKSFRENKALLQQETLKRKKKAKIITLMTIPAAAAAIFLFFLFLPALQHFDPAETFIKNYQLYTPNTAVRDLQTEDSSNALVNLYQSGRAAEALTLANQLITQAPDQVDHLFYKGLILIELNDYQQATAILNDVASKGGSYQTYATWYLALIDLKTSNFATARSRLWDLADSADKTYSSQARKLLRTIRFR